MAKAAKPNEFTLTVPPQPDVVPPRTAAEQALVDKWGDGRPDRSQEAPRIRERPDGTWACDSDDPELWAARMMEVTGTTDVHLAAKTVSRVMGCQSGAEGKRFNDALAALAHLRTREGLETMLVEQIAQLQAVAEQATRNMFAGGISFDAYAHYSKAATRASTAAARCAEALERVRIGVRPVAAPLSVPESTAPSVTVAHAEDATGRRVVVGRVKRAKPSESPDAPARVVGSIAECA